MLYFIVRFIDDSAIRAKSVELHKHSVDIRTDKNEILLINHTDIADIKLTTKSWKALKLLGYNQAKLE